MQLINSSPRYKAVGPYSQAVESEGFVFGSGVIGVTSDGVLAEGLEQQVEEIFANIQSILKERNLSFADIIKTTVFMTDINNFARFNELYAKAFGEHRPARSTVQVAALPRGALIEIEYVAVLHR